MFHHQMKHREDRQKYFAARRIFNSRLASVFHEGREVNKKKRLNFFFSSTRERSGTKLKTESETWGETLSRLTGRVRLARFALVRLLRHALPISLLILRRKPTVLQST